MASSPVAYNPVLTVTSLAPSGALPSPAPGGAVLALTGCAPGGASCSGFRASNSADRTNTATFKPAAKPAVLDPFLNSKLYELGTLELSNGGFAVPADAGAPLVPIVAALRVATQGSGKSPTALAVSFSTMWTPGSPSPPNNAGLFALATRPAPGKAFSVAMAPGVDVALRLDVVGFTAAPGTDASVLGDWGQPPPKAGEPGPRVFVKPNAGPVSVKLWARVSRS